MTPETMRQRALDDFTRRAIARAADRTRKAEQRAAVAVTGLTFTRHNIGVRGGVQTVWRARYEGTLIGQWTQHGAGVVEGDLRHHVYLRDWREACRAEATRRRAAVPVR